MLPVACKVLDAFKTPLALRIPAKVELAVEEVAVNEVAASKS